MLVTRCADTMITNCSIKVVMIFVARVKEDALILTILMFLPGAVPISLCLLTRLQLRLLPELCLPHLGLLPPPLLGKLLLRPNLKPRGQTPKLAVFQALLRSV